MLNTPRPRAWNVSPAPEPMFSTPPRPRFTIAGTNAVVSCDRQDVRAQHVPDTRSVCLIGQGLVADARGEGGSAQQPFQRRSSAVSALAATFATSLVPRGEVVIVMLGDGPEEMEITLINCQADKSDEAACHHIP